MLLPPVINQECFSDEKVKLGMPSHYKYQLRQNLLFRRVRRLYKQPGGYVELRLCYSDSQDLPSSFLIS
jgi:hypothetical protein